MSWIYRCFLGPRIYKLYRYGSRQGRDYEGNLLEHYSDCLIKFTTCSLSMAWALGFYTAPLLASFMYRKGYFTSEGLFTLYKLSSTFGMFMFVCIFIRGLGRMMSNDYITFVSVLNAYKENRTRDMKLEICHYDFDFRDWPVDFHWRESTLDNSKPRLYVEKGLSRRSTVEKFKSVPCNILSFIAIHTFGRMMIYPGSVGLLNMVLAPMLLKGRAKLMEEYNGERFKLLTKDGNEIDSLLVDRRENNFFPNGNILVICCEGNAGFYEYGTTLTPIEAGYSVLGWNHPGFGSSTGTPYPDQELNAMDIVMQFAISKLGFKPENIVIYAWSIGGYSATWAAMNYPTIKGLVLDATFDDLVALAVARMPPSWKPLVVRAIRDYMDLNNAEQLCRYDGPVILIRRTRDEVIATNSSRSIQTNRGNDLLIKVFQARYPKIVNNETLWLLKEWLSADKHNQTVLWSQHEVEDELCDATLKSYVEENGLFYPLEIGDDLPTNMKLQLLLYLADKYMIDFDSTHCAQLPSRMFQLPWNARNISVNQSKVDTKSRI
ncbi:phosphatidylserine lipase ABHD16A-like [Uloborus diversus]|uniref:phosphatidylserine lipase ABHD16A-like n=1 Tax=Uloborus diversus TaxID=327109 RepID=UPI00240A9556|nr:phosphatidylserine lipase ABHD16A-like [Uloborus diversus]